MTSCNNRVTSLQVENWGKHYVEWFPLSARLFPMHTEKSENFHIGWTMTWRTKFINTDWQQGTVCQFAHKRSNFGLLSERGGKRKVLSETPIVSVSSAFALGAESSLRRENIRFVYIKQGQVAQAQKALCWKETCSISWENRRHFSVTFAQLFAQMPSSDICLLGWCIDFLYVPSFASQDCVSVIDVRLVCRLWVKTWRQHDFSRLLLRRQNRGSFHAVSSVLIDTKGCVSSSTHYGSWISREDCSCQHKILAMTAGGDGKASFWHKRSR